jgi:signal transduction histidine kinase
MIISTIARHEDLLAALVHDLRQPLGNIETSVFLLNLLTPPDDARLHAQLHIIECQLRDAARMLTEASTALRGMRAQRVDTVASVDLTNPASAGVT